MFLPWVCQKFTDSVLAHQVINNYIIYKHYKYNLET